MIKAVIFDLGSVLASDEWPLVYEKISQETGIGKEKVKDTVKPIFRVWCAGEIDEQGFWKIFEHKTGKKLPQDFTRGFWRSTYKKWSKDIQGTWDIAAELAVKELRLALLSNITKTHVLVNEEMKRLYRLRDMGFEDFIWSYEEKVCKPDPRIYEVALARLNLAAGSCVFIDDKRENAEAARRLGMEAIHFKEPEQLRVELMRLDLLWEV